MELSKPRIRVEAGYWTLGVWTRSKTSGLPLYRYYRLYTWQQCVNLLTTLHNDRALV